MIPIIGVMIGAYIITRMIELIAADRHSTVKGFAVVTMLLTVFCVIFLLNPSSSVAGLP